jgi:ATP-dependent protease ClpP protease subunit
MKTIKVNGAIIANNEKAAYEFYGVESTSPNDVISQLIDELEDIEVVISSGGGNVFAGSEIYTALKEHKGQVTVKIPSFAASSASIIAMGADKVLMSPTSQMMIHNVA